jgi:uncharacterized surface protein with fasciclin (FAS1) repeats
MRLTFAIIIATLFLILNGSNGEEESSRELQFRPRASRPGQRTQPPSRARVRPPSRPRPGLLGQPVKAPDTIVDFVVGNPDLTSLTAAVVRAGLGNALASGGSFTLFAPNNDAFAAVPPDIAEQLFNDSNFIPQLVDLLLLHVIAGRFLAADLELIVVPVPGGPSIADTGVTGLNGELVLLEFPPLKVQGNNVVDGNNIVSNGVVHVIDGVLIPTWVFNSLADRISGLDIFSEQDLTTLFRLLVLAEIDLSGPSALTVVGPTNAAFALLDPAAVEILTTTAAGLIELTAILQYHVFFGILTSSILVDGFVQTLEGGVVAVSTGPLLMFNNATAVKVDILANNGVLHKIDQVLDPNDSPAV